MRTLVVVMVVALSGCAAPAGPQGPKEEQLDSGATGTLDGLTEPQDRSGLTPGGTPEPYTSGSRLQAMTTTLTGDDGSEVNLPDGFYDTQLGTKCSLATAADGARRCLPISALCYGFYSDAGCSSPVASIPCSAPQPKYAYAQDAGCSDRVRIYAVTGQAGEIYVGSPGSCVKGTPAATIRYYATSGEVPASNFVAFR